MAEKKCFNCGKEVDDESYCFGCSNYVCDDCDIAAGSTSGPGHDRKEHLREPPPGW